MKANTRKKKAWGLQGKDKEYSQYKKTFKAIMGYLLRCIIVMSNGNFTDFLLFKSVFGRSIFLTPTFENDKT